MNALLLKFSHWYLATLSTGSYPLIAFLMALESTLIPIPSEMIIPPAAYLAHTRGELSLVGIIVAGTAGSWLGATIMYWLARGLGRPFLMRYGRYMGLGAQKLERAEVWAARYGWGGVFFSRLLPVIRHLIGVPAGIVRMDFRWYSLATLIGSAFWCSVLAWLGVTVGKNPELLAGSLHRFAALVVAVAAVMAGLYYLFVYRAMQTNRDSP